MVAAHAFRVVFFGTPAFAVPTLDAILSSNHTVVAAISQPDRPSGRGHRTVETPVKARAQQAGVTVLQPEKLKDPAFLDALAALHADIGVVAAYGRILTDAVIAIPRHGLINVHASLLPKYRGAAPVHRAVIAGETETGVTIMRIVRELDAGPMLSSGRRPIAADETSVEVERDLGQIGASLLVSTLDRMATESVPEIPQDHAQATFAPKLTKEDGVVDWSQTAYQLHDLIRGLYPWPHAFSFLNGRRFILLRSTPMPNAATDAPPGTVLSAAGDHLEIATAAGILRVVELQAEGKRPMSAREFLAGHRISTGDRFTGTEPGPG